MMRWRTWKVVQTTGILLVIVCACQVVLFILQPVIQDLIIVQQPKEDSQDITEDQKRDTPAPPKVLCRRPLATWQTTIDSLLAQMGDDPYWSWVKRRVIETWPYWVNVTQGWKGRDARVGNRARKRIVVVPGVLMATHFAHEDNIHGGGPLGDLVQWADLITGLHLLGHNVSLERNFYQVARNLRYGHLMAAPAVDCIEEDIDLVYADIISMKTFPKDVLANHRCKFRIVDAYGTEAMYNDAAYAELHGLGSNWGQLGMNLKQFLTFYPHTPDNSFLGFVVSRQTATPKQNIAVLYGKDPSYFKGKEAYIGLLQSKLEVHATLVNGSVLPSGVVNHGLLTSEEYHQLLSKAKVFIGVVHPLESTGVMEALAHGCIFLNPRYKGNQTRILQAQGKPTSRRMSSQVPYLEEYVGPPHVYTVDIDNSSQILEQLENIIPKTQVYQFIPLEFTLEGFLDRLCAYLRHQDFCNKSNVWPPLKALKMVMGEEGQSCNMACQTKGLVCEPVFFEHINHNNSFEHRHCQRTEHRSDIYYPASEASSETCLLQDNTALFSCAGGSSRLSRVCPCRDFIKYQLALCEGCT